MTRRLTAHLTAAAGLALCGCAGFRPDPIPGYAWKPRTVEGRIQVTMYSAPEWTPGEPMPARVLENMLAREFDRRPRLDDLYYVAVPPEVFSWARLQTDIVRREAASQIRDLLRTLYGLDGDSRFYELSIPEAQDCDDFAHQARVLMRWLIGIRYGIGNATPAVGVLYVLQTKAWGGIPLADRIGHALNWVLLDMESGPVLAVFEPRGGALAPVSDYPNRTYDLLGSTSGMELWPPQ